MPYYDHILLIRLGLDRWAQEPARRLPRGIRLRAAWPAPGGHATGWRLRWCLQAVRGALNRSA
ncbi:hypothetical protein GLS40_14685 [Pseudooceanicola sp. 216_PA32_1]|uniref:Uncharacterized protein n=1 Tax=Pseudooceanicola pacificus TaxID=2676438 RepID=A0A844W8V5_9RHOB|nr:hypothetical protein [Pseudooceanicola pacificus]MWB79284.1 hypothetical protein [Pseudooceanicola pacificus]